MEAMKAHSVGQGSLRCVILTGTTGKMGDSTPPFKRCCGTTSRGRLFGLFPGNLCGVERRIADYGDAGRVYEIGSVGSCEIGY